MSTILTQKRPFNLETTNAIPNGDVGYTKPVGLVYVTFSSRSGEHELFIFDNNQWTLHETLVEGESKNIKMENINQFYVRCKVASGVIRISPKVDKSANTAIRQDLKYGKSLSETSNLSQRRSDGLNILKASGSDLSIDSNASVSVQVSTTSIFPSINSVSLDTIDSDVYLVTVNGENLTKDTQLYIYDSQIDDSTAQSLSAGYLDENDSSIGELVDLVAYSVYSEKPDASSFGTLEFIPEEGVVCVNTNQTFGNKNPISFISSYEMKIAMKGVLGINSYSVFAKDDNGSFLHKGSFTLDISSETEEIPPANNSSVISYTTHGDTTESNGIYCLDGNGDYLVLDGDHRFSDQFTISGWFKTGAGLMNDAVIFSNHDAGQAANGNVMSIGTNGKLRVKTADSGIGKSGDALNLGYNLNDGKWHHFAVTWQASTTNGRKIYLDGDLVHQNNSGVAKPYRTSAQSLFYVGAMWNYITNQLHPGAWFSGCVKDVGIENTIMNSEDVFLEYITNMPEKDGLEDVATMHNGAYLYDGELVLDGTDQYASLQDNDLFDRLDGEDTTMHFWFYANSFSLNKRMTLMRKGVTGSPDWDGYIIEIRNTSHDNIATGSMGIKIFSTDSNNGVEPNNTIFRPAGGISLNQWHHVAVTMKDSNDQIEVYFDGQSLGYWTASQGLSHGNDYNLTLGGDGVSGRTLDGKMKKVTIEKSILTSEQILALYNADAPTAPNEAIPTPNLYFDGSSTDSQIGDDYLTLGSGVSLGIDNGKYDSNFVNYGPSGDASSAILGNGINLSTGVYTFSLWFYNKRDGSDMELVLRQHVNLANPPVSSNYPILINTVAAGASMSQELGVMRREGSSNVFYGTGFSMAAYAGLNDWTHLSVVSDGTNSTFYVNGQQAGNQVAASITVLIQQLGSYSRGYQTFAEGIDEFAYWDSTLTADQINTIYHSSDKLDSIVPAPPPPSISTPDLYFDGSSTESQIGSNSLTFSGGSNLSTSLGKYDSSSLNFGVSGTKSMLLETPLSLNGTYTFSAWFYNKRSNNHGAFIKKNGSGLAGAYYPIITHVANNDELGVFNGAFRSSGFSMSSYEGLQEWTHIAVVANGSKSTFYVNGQKVGNDVPHVINSVVQRIGGYGAANQTFAQAIDEFAYWDSALSRQQIAVIYNSSDKLGVIAPVQPPTSQHLEESADATLIADATITNGMLDLDGSGDYLSLPHDVAYDRESGDMSVMLWFKPRAIGFLSTLISKTTGASNWEGWIIALTEDDLSATDINGNSMSNGGFRFFNSQGGNDIKYLAPNGGVSLNEWHHITLVMKAVGSYDFYYDGSLLGSFTPSSKSTVNNIPLIIGANKDGGAQPAYNRMFNGLIDAVTIEKEAFTSDQIAAAYNEGINSGTYDTVISELASVTNAQSNGTLSQGATVVSGMYLDPNTRGQGFSQGTWTNDMRPDNSADDFSFSAFWRIKTANNNDRGWLFGRDGNVNAGGWGIFIKKASDTTVQYEIVKSGGNPYFITDAITTNVFDEFHHVSFTYRNGEWHFYHDGVEVFTTTGKAMPTTNPAGNKYKLGNGWSVLAIDEVNLFKDVFLTTSQITELANQRSQKDIDYNNNI